MFFIGRHSSLILAAIAAHLHAADGHWQVSTVEGIEQEKPTQFTNPYNPVCIDDNLYLIDNMSCVRKIDLKTREVSTIAGRKEPTAKHIHNDFIGTNAVFNHPQSITSDGSNGLFMTTPQEVIRIDIAAGNTVYRIAKNSAKKTEKFHFLHATDCVFWLSYHICLRCLQIKGFKA